MSQQAAPSVLYVINSFDQGGAEAGLVNLVTHGLFANCQLTIVALVQGRGQVEARLSALGARPQIILHKPRMTPLDLFQLFLGLRRIIGKVRPRFIIASLPQANILARLASWFRRSACFISFEHNTKLANAVYEFGYRLTSSRVDWTFADSETTMNVAMQRLYRSRPARRSVVPLVLFDTPPAVPTRAGAEGVIHIVNAGRFTTQKNQRALIEAVAQLQDPRIRLTLYGEGPLREECRLEAQRLGIQDRVDFPGFVPDWAQRGADLFVLCSRHEGLCLVVLEAMHGGIPVVSPSVGGVRDYGSSGIYYEATSVDAADLAQAIGIALKDPHEGSRLATRASAMVKARFGAPAVRGIYSDINRLLHLLPGQDGSRA